jgi:ribosomal-protein-alanine N-acetyltransferase
VPPIELTGPRIRARDWRIGDADLLWRFAGEQEGIFTAPGEITSLPTAGKWIERQVDSQSSPWRTQYRLALELLDEDTLIGGARIHVEDPEHHQASLGYALHHTHWGKGYATEAATLMLDLAFGQLGIHRVEAHVEPSNTASVRVVEKLGMRREGHLVGRLQEGEHWLDVDLFGITADEWAAR